MEKEKDWFETWFDSTHYHRLYSHRSEDEADHFIKKLADVLPIPARAEVLDLACGTGRHSRVLHRLGCRVTGIDLSRTGIEYAKTHSAKDIRFVRADMRNFELDCRFDFILNLFTSFGYFHKESDNLKVLSRMHHHLNPSGRVVIDYLNDQLVRSRLKTEETIEREGVRFSITRRIEGNVVIKTIAAEDAKGLTEFTESVQLFGLSDFERMAEKSGFTVENTFGGYDLCPFDPKTSERLIPVLTPIH